MRTNISGFPEYTPSEQLAFDAITAKIKHVYESFGYVPLETAAVERIETLTSKGIDSKEVYALRRLNAQSEDGDKSSADAGDKNLALRFDLTVPLARYVSQNYSSLTFPYRRYQCQPVWRGERPQYGRYRQFHQFDLDVIADGKLPLEADAEIIAASNTALTAILPQGTQFTMRINNRKLLTGLVEGAGYTGDQIYQAIKVIDDLEKVSPEEANNRLTAINGSASVQTLLTQLRTKDLASLTGLTPLAEEGRTELQAVLNTLKSLVPGSSVPGSLVADLTIARGLDYYTGTVVETRLHAAPELGSICSGGRYDNLTASLSERNLPGVGISIGISRLAAWLMDQPPYNAMPATTAKLIVTGPAAATTCQQLRAHGVACELAMGDKSAGQHFQTAQKRGLAYGLVADDAKLSLRTFETRAQEDFTLPDLIPHLKSLFG